MGCDIQNLDRRQILSAAGVVVWMQQSSGEWSDTPRGSMVISCILGSILTLAYRRSIRDSELCDEEWQEYMRSEGCF